MLGRPNCSLRSLMAEASWTGQQLAVEVNKAAAEVGVAMRVDRTSVSHWLAGRQPRPPVPGLIAEVLTRELGRPVCIGDTGIALGAPPGQVRDDRCILPGGAQAATELVRLVSAQDGRYATAYSVAGLAVPDWHAITPPRPRPASDSGRLAVPQVQAVEAMADLFNIADHSAGGGRCQPALSAYLAYVVAPLLHAEASPGLRRRMFNASTRLTYLCGFTYFDDRQNARAQRYYRTALELAAENGDATAHAIVLRAMSVQAVALGHYRHAVRLAEAAATSDKHMPPLQQAFVYGQVAVAYAANRDPVNARAALAAAERQLHRAEAASANDFFGAYDNSALAVQTAEVLAAQNESGAAVKALSQSLRYRAPGHSRSRAITLARLAELQLEMGLPEEAAATWISFLDGYPALRSGRVTAAFKGLRGRFRTFARNAVVRDALDRAAIMHAGPRR